MQEVTDEQPELTAISSLVFWDFETQWEAIAEYVRDGCPDPQFLYLLCRSLAPKTYFRGLKLGVRRPKGRPAKLGTGDGHHLLIRLLHYEHRERWGLEMIAEEIEKNGLRDERLRDDLAAMFSREGHGPLGMAFDVCREKKGKPRRALKLDAQNFMELHRELFREQTVKAVVDAAARIFGLSEDTARNYRKERRRFRKCDAENWDEEQERQVAYAMREAGYPEYQPLSKFLKNPDL